MGDIPVDRVLAGLREPERYEIFEELGRGGMAVVYRARDRRLGRDVALKRMRDDFGAGPDDLARFRREAEAAAKLTHPNVVTVYDAGPDYLVMELVKATPGARLTPAMLEKVARGVHAAHEAGIVHRDLKPSNILIGEGGEPKVADFGIAQLLTNVTVLTQSGMIVGTPQYMAPEQVEGRREAIGPRTDVYALGAILYEIQAQRPPFTGATPAEVLQRILNEDPKPLDGDLGTIALKALDKEPTRRYASAAEFADDLARWREGFPIQARPPSALYRIRKSIARRKAAVGVGAVGAALLAALAVIYVIDLARSRRIAKLWGDVSVIMAEAERYAWAGDVEGAHRRYDAAIALCTEDVVDAHYFRGRLLHARGRRAEAIAALTKAAAMGEARYERGLCYVEEYEESLDRVQSAFAGRGPGMDVAPPSGDELEALHPGLGELKRRAEADLAVTVGESAYFRPIDGRYGRAELARLRWEFDAAIRELEAILTQEPLYIRARLSMTKAAMFQRKYAEAIEHASAAIAAHKGLGEAHYWRGRATYLVSGKLDEARADLERALELSGEQGRIRAALGDVKLRSGDASGAIEDYSKAGDDAFAYNGRGVAKFSKSDFRGAEADFTAAIKIAPGYAMAYANRAKVRMALSDMDGARKDAEDALRKAPSDAPYRKDFEALRDLLGP